MSQNVLSAIAGLLLSMQLAAALPDPGDPAFPGIALVFGVFLGALRVRIGGGSWKRAEREGFRWGFYLTAWGLLAYIFGLITGLY